MITIPCDETPVTVRSPISPLMRAALDNGVSFENVSAYCEAHVRSTGRSLEGLYYESLVMSEPEPLEAALLRSVLAQGTIEHARLWWRGVL